MRNINKVIKNFCLYLLDGFKKTWGLGITRHEYLQPLFIILVLGIFVIFPYFSLTSGPNDWCCSRNNAWHCFFERISLLSEPLNIQNLLVGIVGIFGLSLLWIRTGDQIRKTKIEMDRRLDERFDGAVNALSKPLTSDSYPAHLGAISSLTLLAIDSPDNTQKCLDVLCSCNDWMGDYLDKFSNKYKEETIDKYKYLMVEYIVKVTGNKDYSDEVDLTLESFDELNYEYPSDMPNKGAELYPYKRLTESNRIANNLAVGKIVSILEEKRSQVVLRAVKEILIALSTKNKSSLDFKNKFLCGIDLSNWLAKDSQKYINLDNIDLSHSYLNGVFMFNVQIKRANLKKSDMSGAMLFLSNAYKTNFRSAELENAWLFRTKLESAELNHAKMQHSHINSCNLQGTQLRHAALDMSAISDSQMQGIDLSHARMMFINFMRHEGLGQNNLYMQGANLSCARLQGADFRSADMRGVNLSGSSLLGTNFESADLSYSIMINPIQLLGANIQNANLESLVFGNEFIGRNFSLNRIVEDNVINKIILSLAIGQPDMYHDQINETWKVIETPDYPDKIKNLILAKGINNTKYEPEQTIELGEYWLQLCSNNRYIAGKLLRLREILSECSDYSRDLLGLTDVCQIYIYKELEKEGKINEVRPPLSDDTKK